MRKFRLEAGLTQDELARRAGMEQQALSALEKRDSKSSAFLGALAEALGKTPQELLGLPVAVESAAPPQENAAVRLGDLLELIRVFHETDAHGRDLMLASASAAAKRIQARQHATGN